ncbi:MAG TPA: glutaredoxin family protein [Rhodanobacteraceae bacterium]
MHLILFQRDDCHLCEQAIALLARAHAPDFESMWIDGDAELEARYGERVPVLRDQDSGRELGWPFDARLLQTFLEDKH